MRKQIQVFVFPTSLYESLWIHSDTVLKIWNSAKGSETIYFDHHPMLYVVSSAAVQSEMVPDREICKKQAYNLFTLDKFINEGQFAALLTPRQGSGSDTQGGDKCFPSLICLCGKQLL